MVFSRIDPHEELMDLIEWFWIVENSDPAEQLQKIIPDGFPEMIFHFGDPYRIQLKSPWSPQSKSLFAGQITSHFFLQNTGKASILGVKWKPAAMMQLFHIPMRPLTDRVVPLEHVLPKFNTVVTQHFAQASNHTQRIQWFQDYLRSISSGDRCNTTITKALDLISSTNGLATVTSLCAHCDTSERQLQRLFLKYVGLSPKFYARIIRFNYIFKIMQDKKVTGPALGLDAGFYDQSHFIKNFKAFTGEDPSQYFFDQTTLANFFLMSQ